VLGGTLGSGKGTGDSAYKRHHGDSTGPRSVGASRRGAFKSAKSALDETSSERGFNEASYYEMGSRDRAVKEAGHAVNVYAETDALSSDEMVNRSAQTGHPDSRIDTDGGIIKTVTASVKYHGRA
jgi:hypothetical protein